ncbi:hypothetical protein WJR50_14715 [Catalinimonas sp. 4WD22]|uniref:hypothetical protein n=1 Tax=Catalinimonas locisalis TaxID=3133978 RepID=UPI00310176B4
MKNSLEEQLAEGRISLSNAMSNTEIMKKLSKLNYDMRELQRGWGIMNQVEIFQKAKIEKYSNQFGATQALYDDIRKTKASFSKHRKLARIVYEGNKEKISVLQLDKRMFALEKWLFQAGSFYQELLKDSAMIVKYGVSLEELQQMAAMVQALLDKRNHQVSRKGEAQHATQKRNEALKAYKAWMKDFRMAARFALREEPQLLEVLGILVPTPR